MTEKDCSLGNIWTLNLFALEQVLFLTRFLLLTILTYLCGKNEKFEQRNLPWQLFRTHEIVNIVKYRLVKTCQAELAREC